MCGKPAPTKEHVPPKCFFPKGAGLQLKTVPSCLEHNNAKSNDDQYLLAHICMHAASENNIAKQRFHRSISPNLVRKPAFHTLLSNGSVDLLGGARKYRVDLKRFDNFFDHLTCAIYFDRYSIPLNRAGHQMRHTYLSLSTDDPQEQERRKFLVMGLGHFFEDFRTLVSAYEAGRVDDESIYMNNVIDPAGPEGSITIAHTFYGVFDAVSMLTRVAADA
jgi:hypothetical protein